MELAIRMTEEAAPPGSDDALVQSFVEGDDAAFEQLVRRHEALVLRIVRRFARDGDDARDLAQKTFVRAFEAARRTFQRSFQSGFHSSGAERVPFQRWLVRIAVNLGRNHARDANRWTRAPVDRADAQPHDGQDPMASLVREQRAALLRGAMLKLPPRQREVLALRLDTELSFAEIAAALEITENSAKVSFHHAARRLRELLREREE